MLEINTKAIDFNLQDENGNYVKLSDFLGKKVVLYFYPKDNTPGCTIQACNFRDLNEDFNDLNAVVIGISKDSIESHKKFKEKFNLSFILLSDPNLEAIKAYEVWEEKSMFNKKYMGIVRSTYIINEEGYIIKAFKKVSSSKNPKDMLKELN